MNKLIKSLKKASPVTVIGAIAIYAIDIIGEIVQGESEKRKNSESDCKNSDKAE